MIPYDRIKIKAFGYIDRMQEGLGSCKPKEGEEYIGRRNDDYYIMYVEHWIGDKLNITINCTDISWIQFIAEDTK